METNAIKRIEELTRAAMTQDLDSTFPAAVLPSGCSLHNLEHYLEAPTRQRVQFQTHRIGDFAAYVRSEALTEGETSVFVRPDGDGAEAIIDFGAHEAPLHKEHRARLELRETPEFRALRLLTDKPRSQREIIEWLEDWAHAVIPERDDETMEVAAAIAALRKVDLKAVAKSTHEHQDFAASRSSFAQLDAQGNGAKLPGTFALEAAVYEATGARVIRARLTLQTGDDAPRFRLRIVGEDRLYQTVAEEVTDTIAEECKHVRCLVGTVA